MVLSTRCDHFEAEMPQQTPFPNHRNHHNVASSRSTKLSEPLITRLAQDQDSDAHEGAGEIVTTKVSQRRALVSLRNCLEDVQHCLQRVREFRHQLFNY